MNDKDRMKYSFLLTMMFWIISISTAVFSNVNEAIYSICVYSLGGAVFSSILTGIFLVFIDYS